MVSVQSSLGDAISFGAAHGACYAGSMDEDTGSARIRIGPAVIIARRLMQEAEVGSTLIPKSDSIHWQALAGLFHAGTLLCKGMKSPVSTMRITRYFEEPAKTAALAGRKLVTVAPDHVTKTSLSGFASACEALLGMISMESRGTPCSADGMPDIAEHAGMASHEISAIAAILAVPGHDMEFRACPESEKPEFLANGMAALLSVAAGLCPLALLFRNVHEYPEADLALARSLAARRYTPSIRIVCTSADEALAIRPDEIATGSAENNPGAVNRGRSRTRRKHRVHRTLAGLSRGALEKQGRTRRMPPRGNALGRSKLPE